MAGDADDAAGLAEDTTEGAAGFDDDVVVVESFVGFKIAEHVATRSNTPTPPKIHLGQLRFLRDGGGCPPTVKVKGGPLRGGPGVSTASSHRD